MVPPCPMNRDATENVLGVRNMLNIPIVFCTGDPSDHMIIDHALVNPKRTGGGGPLGRYAGGDGHDAHTGGAFIGFKCLISEVDAQYVRVTRRKGGCGMKLTLMERYRYDGVGWPKSIGHKGIVGGGGGRDVKGQSRMNMEVF